MNEKHKQAIRALVQKSANVNGRFFMNEFDEFRAASAELSKTQAVI
jgi:hypothetical protein